MAPLPSQSGNPRPWRARAADSRVVRDLSAEFGLEPVVATVLANRNIDSVDTAARFLDPSVDELLDPFELADMDRAATRIARAISDKETILIYGDADVDGLSGTALLMHFLRFLGTEPLMHVPNRAYEGYSFTDAGVAAVIEQGANLVISVDNGVSSVEAVGKLQAAGIDVVITDHHLPPPELPPAHAVVNPRRTDCEYPFKELSGCGVAFKVACAVASRLSEGQRRSPDMMRFLGEAMAWVALGTVSDMMELRGENRVLVKRGLRAIPLTTHPGLAALCRVSGVNTDNFSAEDIAFRIAPRLNAASRMGRTDLSLSLVTSNDPKRSDELARQLDSLNKQRQVQDRAMFAQILPLLEGLGDDADAFVMRDDSWNSGLLGLVASRIAQHTGRPAALVSGLNGDPAKGSVRSVPGFSAHAALVSCSEHLATHGGHAAAAGFSVANENFDAFREAFVARWRDHRAAGWEPEPLEYDGELPLPALTRRVVEQLKRLEPFGQGNPSPVLGAKGVTVQSIRRMGDDGSHLALDLAQGPVALRAVSFSNGDLADHLHLGQVVDILFVPRLNTWRGRTTVQLELVDLKFPQSAGNPAPPPAPDQTAPETQQGAA